MLDAILKGIGAGLLLTVMVGPVFFALLQNSLEKGYRKTIPMIIGISLSDIMYIAICFFGVSGLIDNSGFRFWLSLAGGIIMLTFGIYSFYKNTSRRPRSGPIDQGYRSAGKMLAKGFLINGINPSVLFFWLGMVSMATINHRIRPNETVLFLFCIIATVFLMDNMKSFLAHKLSNMITSRFLRILNGITGTGFILLSLKLFHSAYTLGFA